MAMLGNNIQRAQAIQGWMDPGELSWLALQAACHETIVEVGCWRGRATFVLAENTRGTVYAVDHWRADDDTKVYLPAGVDNAWLEMEFRRNLAEMIAAGTVAVETGASLEVAARFRARGQTVDMVFIDAAHDYASVREDIVAWNRILRPGGILAGHDWRSEAPGVRRAVEEALVGFWVVPGTAIWSWLKR